MRVHLFPSRTQKLSSFAPTIVAGRLAVKIGNANISLPEKEGFFLVCYRVCLKLSCCNSGSVFAGHAPLANHLVAATPYCSLYLPQAALANVPPGMFFHGKIDPRFLAVKIGNANISLKRGSFFYSKRFAFFVGKSQFTLCLHSQIRTSL